MLKRFGHNIRNLKIERNDRFVDPKHIKQVYKLIQEHCTETLSHLHLERVKYDFFENVTKPFKNVQEVSLKGKMASLGNDQLNFQQIFPSLRRQYLNEIRNRNSSNLELEYPHLECTLRAEVNKYNESGSTTAPIIMGII